MNKTTNRVSGEEIGLDVGKHGESPAPDVANNQQTKPIVINDRGFDHTKVAQLHIT